MDADTQPAGSDQSERQELKRSRTKINSKLTFDDLDASMVVERDRIAANIVTGIFDHIHDQLIDRTEAMSDIEMDYTVLRAVNHTIDKLFEGQTLPMGWPVDDH